MLNKRVRFYVRIIPDEREGRECLETDGNKILRLKNEKYIGMKKLPLLRFETDGIFTEDCQAVIYETVIGKDLYSSITKMSDVVLMAIGQSGTGKSYTMTGIRDHYHFRGVIPRIFDAIFTLKKKKDFALRMCALEFIHGKCRDLFVQSTPEIDCRKVTGLRLNDESEANDLLFKAESNRCRISTGNCGTMVVTLFLKPHSSHRRLQRPVSQKIHLIDPAGTEVHWSRLRGNPCLTKNIGTLNESYVPDPSNDWAFLIERSIKGRLDARQAYRNSTMVGYLCDSLRTGCIRLIGHIRRSSDDLRYSLATLRYGCGVTGRPEQQAEIQTEAKVNIIDHSLQKEIQQLRDELAITDLLESNFVPFSAELEEGEALNIEVESYLTSPDAESCAYLLTMAHPFTLLGTCRSIYRKSLERLRDMYDLEGVGGEKGSLTTGITVTSSPRGSKKSRKKSVQQHGDVHEQMFGKSADQIILPTPSAAKILVEDAKETRCKSTVAPEIIEKGKSNRNPLWKEFLSRNPHWHMKLTAVGEDLRQARADREAVEEKVKDLITKLQQNKFEVERTMWERISEAGNPVRPDGQPLPSEEEQVAQNERTALLQAHKIATENFRQVHNYFKQVTERFIEAHEGANQLFTDYVNTTYENTLVLPGTEDYEETIPILGTDYSIKPTITKSEEDFIQLQNKYLNTDRRDPPLPRWP
uniref:Kinesin-like protein KIF9 n=2 Tax=Lygus hesperus TaxID=30085 RepID=A0A0A9YFU7_LYGHE